MPNTADILIRRATPDDAEGILRAHSDAVHAKATAYYTAEQIAGWAAQAIPEKIADKKQRMLQKESIVFVALRDQKIIGFSELVLAKKELGAVYVAPGPWRGIGSRLLDEALNEARTLSMTELICDSSLNAEAFYSRHGFEVLERTTHRLRIGLDIPCVKMKKLLAR